MSASPLGRPLGPRKREQLAVGAVGQLRVAAKGPAEQVGQAVVAAAQGQAK